ncbi:Actin-related protein 6 [Phytophthora cactorum]|nr:Actin-related protein 6 [Phytophthora cactorum]
MEDDVEAQTDAVRQEEEEQALEMGVEMVTVPEVLFHPSDIGINQAGIAETIVQAVEACPEELSDAFYANILLVGGNTKFKNFRQRLERDLRSLVPDDFDIGLHEPSDPILAAWRGCCSLAESDALSERVMHSQLRRCMQSASRSITQQRSMSFKVRVGAVETPKFPIAERQRVQQTWGISGHETLEKLRVATPGLTGLVSILRRGGSSSSSSSDQLVAVARVSSDAHDLLERVDVLARGSNRLLIGFDPHPPRGWPVEEPIEPGKHLLTEIFVREAKELRNLGAFGGGSLVVTDSEHGSVLVNDRPYGKLKLASFRGNRVFVTQEQGLRAGRVSLFAGRGGQLFLCAPEIIAKDRVRVAAAGRWGDSKIVVQTPILATPSLGAAVTGSGKVRFSAVSNEGKRHCEYQSLAIAGSGSIDTGDVTSRYGRVAIRAQTSESLTVGTLGSARVNYLEPGPDTVRGRSSSLRTLSAAAKAQHDQERAAIATDATPPTRESVFEDTGSTLNRCGGGPGHAVLADFIDR